MKKLLAIICAGVMSLSVAACQSVETTKDADENNSAVTETTNNAEQEAQTDDTTDSEAQQTQSDAQDAESGEDTDE